MLIINYYHVKNLIIIFWIVEYDINNSIIMSRKFGKYTFIIAGKLIHDKMISD